MDRLRAMKVFVCVAKAGRLSAAARVLGLPLSTLSRSLADLETHLGTTLVARTTRHVALTPAGVTYLDVCRRVLDDIEHVESRLGGRGNDLAGPLVVTAPVLFGRLHVLPVVINFLERYPHVDIRLDLADQNLDLAKDGIDIAVRIGGLKESALLATRVGAVGLVTVASPAHLRRHGKPAAPAELADHDCIAFSNRADAGRWIFKSKRHGRSVVQPKARLTVSNVETAIEAAVAGAGVTRVLSYQAESVLRAGKLTPLLADYDDQVVPIHIVRRPLRLPSMAVTSFAGLLVETLRKQFASSTRR